MPLSIPGEQYSFRHRSYRRWHWRRQPSL